MSIVTDCQNMKIALGQIKIIPNNAEKNITRILEMVRQAKEQEVDLIVFPEMAIGGYMLGDDWLRDDVCADLMKYNELIRKESESGIAIAFGNIFLDDKINERIGDPDGYHPDEDGRARRYNAVYVYQNGNPVPRQNEPLTQNTRKPILPPGITIKTLLPNYRFFDDKRYFHSLLGVAQDSGTAVESLIQPFLISFNGNKIPIGFILCEDMWCREYRKNNQTINPTKILIENGARAIFNLSSSPWTFGKNNARDKRVKHLQDSLNNHKVPFFYVNCTGAQNNGKNIITFDGGTTIYNQQGDPVILSRAPYQEELFVTAIQDIQKKTAVTRTEKPKIAQKFDALIEGFRHIKDNMGAKSDPTTIIGLSGGIDSAVSAALAVIAFGKDKVMAVNMPTKYNSSETKTAAAHTAEKLGINYQVIPIDELVNLKIKMLNKTDLDRTGKMLSTLNEENMQSKIRNQILSDLSAKYDGIYTCNGNKVEISTGYYTLDGDGRGAIAPLGDLLKTEVFELALHINQLLGKEVIPEKLIPDQYGQFGSDKIQPSAELKHTQIDPFKWVYHDAIIEKLTFYFAKNAEDFLEWYIAGSLAKNLGIDPKVISVYEVDKPDNFIKDLDWLMKLIHNNRYKRVQSVPIIVTSTTAWGYDRRESLTPFTPTQRYEALRIKILKENIHFIEK
ncbi:MAG: NAD(+) synthase [Candidatus Margulisbacteria bacterium GWF2_38_17]|nr:MAG: NAD(+) synthase [Candidatus Margulisbacteria bacterium GWF2_38_17]